jgi:hypothetical protein
MDLVMKRLGIELFLEGQQVVPIVHYNVDGRPCGVGKSTWLSTFQGYALKLNPTIDDICRQPIEEMEVIKVALEGQFYYLDYPLAYKYVKN